MWALRTKGDVHILVTKEFTFDLNEASNSTTDGIALQKVSPRSVHVAIDEEALTNELRAVAVAGKSQKKRLLVCKRRRRTTAYDHYRHGWLATVGARARATPCRDARGYFFTTRRNCELRHRAERGATWN